MADQLVTFAQTSRQGLIRFEVQVSAQLQRVLFSQRDWNTMLRAGLMAFGFDFIWQRLPLRFGDFAIDELGYDAKKLHAEGDERSSRRAFGRALADGTMDRLAARWSRGWNPWKNPFPPDAMLKAFIQYQRRANGRFMITRTGEWRTARRELRKITKEVLRVKLAAEPYVYTNSTRPLVETGALEQAALSTSRPVATVTANRQRLEVLVPQPHPTRPIVGRTLRRVTDDELREGERIVGVTVEALMHGAETRPITRGPSKGQVRKRLSGATRAQLGRQIESRRVAKIRAQERHRARMREQHSGRPATTHTPRTLPA